MNLNERFQIGNGVYHPKYGIGVIAWYGPDADKYGVRLDFDGSYKTCLSSELESRPKRGEYIKFPRRH